MLKFKIVFLTAFFTLSVAGTLFAASIAPLSYSKGMLAFSDEHYQEALEYFQTAVRLDGSNPDYLYFLGLTETKMENPSNAVKYFRRLLRDYPNYNKAYFEYGVAHFKNKNFASSLTPFQKAHEISPKEQGPLFYTALSNHFLGKNDLALEKFKETRDLGPTEPMGKASTEWILKIEGGASGLPTPENRLSLNASVGNFYDSNVTLDPDDEDLVAFNSNQDDGVTMSNLRLGAILFQGHKSQFKAGASFYQSAYWNAYTDLDRFNYGRYRTDFDYRYRFNKNLQIRIPFFVQYASLGMANYQYGGNIKTALDWTWKERWMTTLSAGVDRDVFFTAPSNLAQIKDAYRTALALEQYLFFQEGKAFLKVGFQFELNQATGDDWDSKAYSSLFAFNAPLFFDWNLLVTNKMDYLRAFDRIDSVFATSRGDFTTNVSTALTHRFLKDYMTLTLSHTYIMQDSNIVRFNYRRHIAGATLGVKF